MRINKDIINPIFEKYLSLRKTDDAPMTPSCYILTDIWWAFSEFFSHSLPNFNVCISIPRLAFVAGKNIEVVINYDHKNDSSIWEDILQEWLQVFAQKHNLSPNFEYLYFFNYYGDATLYLTLSQKQLNHLKTFFLEEHDAVKMSHMWSYELLETNFLEHMADFFENPQNNDPVFKTLILYSLKSIDEREHRRSCSYSLTPLEYDRMVLFLRNNNFISPTTRVSFEYKIDKNARAFDITMYGTLVDFNSQVLQFFCLEFDVKLPAFFSLVHHSSDSIFVDFYFENGFENGLSQELFNNFTNANFGAQFVPGGDFSPDLLERVVCRGAHAIKPDEFIGSLPAQNLSYYSLLNCEKRLLLRHYSYAYKGGPPVTPITGMFTYLRNLFFLGLGEHILEARSWFEPIYLKPINFKDPE